MALNDYKIKSAKPKDKQYRLTDGDGLVIAIHPNGSKYWQMRFRFDSKEKLLSLGKYPDISLAQARKERDKVKEMILKGIDPSQKTQGTIDDHFNSIATKWCKSQLKWSEEHRRRVFLTLEQNVFPLIGDKSVKELTTQALLVPIKQVEETGKTELASRIQQRIHAIMRYAVQNGYINYNPAHDLTGCVTKNKVTHRPALELDRLPELLNNICQYQGRRLTKLAIQLTLLIFIRSSELRFARWSEIDFDKRLWTIPAEREAIEGVKFSHRGSKMRTPHLVPLSRQAIEVLHEIKTISGDYELVFIGDHSPYKPMSEGTVNKALQKMGYDTKKDICGHGFRTMACSALVESNQWSRDAVERQMSHQERNDVRAAYIHKAQHIVERTKMVQWWADYLDTVQNGFIMPYEFTSSN